MFAGVSEGRAGHHNPYDGTVRGRNTATVTVLSDEPSHILDGRIYTLVYGLVKYSLYPS